MHIEVDTDAYLARVKFLGYVKAETVIQAINDLHEHPQFRADMPSLWDYRGCEIESLSTQALRELGDLARETAYRHHDARIAIVTGSDLQFGLSRMFIMLNEITHLEFATFRHIEQAERWALRQL